MTQEEKELLIKDLSARIPYKVKASYYGTDEEMECIDVVEGIIIDNNAEIIIGQYGLPIEKVKPYLLPLSSMTEEQKKKYNNLCEVCTNDWGNDMYFDTIDSIDWLLKNQFDIRELIPMGLANDATGLNIY